MICLALRPILENFANFVVPVVKTGAIYCRRYTLNFPNGYDINGEWEKAACIGTVCRVAHNVGCFRHSLKLYGLEKADITYYCSHRAARRLYNFGHNNQGYLCDQFKIPYGQHHRAGDDAEMCARLFLRELRCKQDEMGYCNGRL